MITNFHWKSNFDPLWSGFDPSRYVALFVTLHVTQAKSYLHVTPRTKPREIDATMPRVSAPHGSISSGCRVQLQKFGSVVRPAGHTFQTFIVMGSFGCIYDWFTKLPYLSMEMSSGAAIDMCEKAESTGFRRCKNDVLRTSLSKVVAIQNIYQNQEIHETLYV